MVPKTEALTHYADNTTGQSSGNIAVQIEGNTMQSGENAVKTETLTSEIGETLSSSTATDNTLGNGEWIVNELNLDDTCDSVMYDGCTECVPNATEFQAGIIIVFH